MEVIRLRLPSRISRLTKVLAWATLVSNIGIILTGGAVRLTDSGLGCPEWPRCTADSWVSTPEMGMHGAIEFGNRLLTYVLIIISVAMFLAVIRLWSTHRALVVRTIIIGLGIPLQGVIGGITVWTDLNPWIVALHFLASAGLVLIATQLLTRVNAELRNADNPGYRIVDGETNTLTRSMAGVILVTAWASLVLGTIVTGTGPHAGDPNSPRHDFDLHLVTQLHVIPVYMLCAAAVVTLVVQMRLKTSGHQRRAAWFLIAVILAQGVLGYWQYFAGLPVGLVWLHMLGSALAMVAATQVFDRYRARYATRGLTKAPRPVSAIA